MANNGTLAQLITASRDGRSYDRMAKDCGGQPTGKRLQQLAEKPMAAFPTRETIEGIARGTGASVTEVVLCSARSLGIGVSASFTSGAYMGGLTDDQASTVRLLIRAFVEDNRRWRVAYRVTSAAKALKAAIYANGGNEAIEELRTALETQIERYANEMNESERAEATKAMAMASDYEVEGFEVVQRWQRVDDEVLRDITPRLHRADQSDVPEAALERNPGGTPPGQSEEPET